MQYGTARSGCLTAPWRRAHGSRRSSGQFRTTPKKSMGRHLFLLTSTERRQALRFQSSRIEERAPCARLSWAAVPVILGWTKKIQKDSGSRAGNLTADKFPRYHKEQAPARPAFSRSRGGRAAPLTM